MSKWNFYNELDKKSDIKNITFEEFITNTEAQFSGISIYNVMEKDSTFSACINYLVNSLASMGVDLFQQNKNGRDKQKIHNDLSDVVKNTPNKIDNGFTLLRKIFFNYFLYGYAVAHIKVRKGCVIGIDVLDSSTTTISRKQNTDQIIIEGYLYDKPIKKIADEFIILEDVSCRYKAIQPILEAKHNGLEMVSNYFKNGGSYVKGIITSSADISTEAKLVLKKAFTKVLSENNDGVAILDNGLDYKQVVQNVSLRESLINELRRDLDDEIYTALQVPKSLITGDGKESSYASLSIILNSFVKSLQPYIIQLEKELNRKLLTTNERQEGYYFKMNTNKLLRMNASERASYYKTMVQSGLMSIEECRALEDLPFVEGSEDLLLSLNYVPLTQYEKYLTSKYGVNLEEGGENVEQ